jgi:cobyrinic acid a,c-diamide synthase
LTSASGRACYNLDFNTQSHAQITDLYAKHMATSDLGLIEGNMGLYDGLALDGSNSNAALAALLKVPVILVVNTRGMTRGIAPLLLGYQAFDSNITIAGVILNQVAGSRHEGKLLEVIGHYTDIQALGAVASDPRLNIDERHLGLIPSNEEEASERVVSSLADTVKEAVDLDALLNIAAGAESFDSPITSPPKARCVGMRIGIPRDRAFGFYYPDDLDRMRELGAELRFFNALKDKKLPQIDGLFLGGGFPETAMDELQANSSMMAEIAAFIEAGGATYAECGGLIYLTRSLTWGEKKCKMAGIIPADAVMYEKPQGRGYVRLRTRPGFPWPDQQAGETIRAHEFHHSALVGLVCEQSQFAYDVLRGAGIGGGHDGYVYKNLLASYTHRRGIDATGWVDRFLAHVDACRR